MAPLKINVHATIPTVSTITEDVPCDTLTLAKVRQVTIKNWKGPKFRKNDLNWNGK